MPKHRQILMNYYYDGIQYLPLSSHLRKYVIQTPILAPSAVHSTATPTTLNVRSAYGDGEASRGCGRQCLALLLSTQHIRLRISENECWPNGVNHFFIVCGQCLPTDEHSADNNMNEINFTHATK